MQRKPRILGMGNALVDILTRLDDDNHLERFKLPKGSMTLVDAIKSRTVYEETLHLDHTIRSGGSAANTIHGVANLGMEAGFIGKIGRDNLGKVFRDDLETSRITPHLKYSETESGRAMALISKDAERTFATYLGAAVELNEQDLEPQVFEGYDYFHVEGYLVQNHELLSQALKMANASGMKVSLDMVSYNLVEENLDFLKEMVAAYVDILFANEEEARAFTGKEPREALREMAEMVEIAVVKTGASGSMVMNGSLTVDVGVLPVRVLDTTGAGDLYGAGFLYGLAKEYSLDKCARMGTLLAGHVIEEMGPKIHEKKWPVVKEKVEQIGKGRWEF